MTHVHRLLNNFISRACLTELYDVFDVAETVLRKWHAFIFEALHKKAKTVVVSRRSLRWLDFNYFSFYLVDVWEETKEGSV